MLVPYTTHSIIVAAETSAGIGPFSEAITLETLEEGTNGFNCACDDLK